MVALYTRISPEVAGVLVGIGLYIEQIIHVLPDLFAFEEGPKLSTGQRLGDEVSARLDGKLLVVDLRGEPGHYST